MNKSKTGAPATRKEREKAEWKETKQRTEKRKGANVLFLWEQRKEGEEERGREVEKEEGIGRKEKEAKIAATSVLNHKRTTQYRITGIYMQAYIPDTCMYTYEDKFVCIAIAQRYGSLF